MRRLSGTENPFSGRARQPLKQRGGSIMYRVIYCKLCCAYEAGKGSKTGRTHCAYSMSPNSYILYVTYLVL